jgi:thioredoxin 1
LVRAFDTPINTTDQSIERVLGVDLPKAFVFLDGKAPQALEDAMNRLAHEYAGRLLVVQIQTKDNPASTRRYQVTRVPALVTVRSGETLTKVEGVDAGQFEKHIAYLLGKGPKPESGQRTSAGYGGQPNQGQAQRANTRGRPQTSGAQASSPQAVTDATFEKDVLRSAQPVLVDFWAPWCGPCRMMEPMIERLGRDLGGRLRIAKVNVDENPLLQQRYGVQGIPTMLVVKNGKVVDRWTGALPEATLRSRLAQHV